MKSAYELALERLEQQGIEPPRTDAIPERLRERIEEVRQRSQARLAELEILHRDRLRKTAEPVAREREEDEYQQERRRIEEQRERDLAKLRSDAPPR